MKVVKNGIVNGTHFIGQILSDTVPFFASIVLTKNGEVINNFNQTFPTYESAEACILETWDELVIAESEDK